MTASEGHPHVSNPDFQAFEEAYRALYGRALRLAIRRFGVTVGEDIAAEAMERLFRHFDRLDHETDLWPWVAKVVVNLGRDRYRAERVMPAPYDVAMAFTPTRSAAPEDIVVLAEERRLIRHAFRGIRPEDRRLLNLREIERCRPVDIAERLGKTPAAVRQHLARARANLRRAYLELAGDVPSSGATSAS